MDKYFSFKEVRQLLNTKNRTVKNLEYFDYEVNNEKKKLNDIYNSLYQKGFEEVIKNVSIDEINFDKSGIRIKLLKDININTLYDLSKTKERTLININGISEEGAKHIITNLNVLLNQYSKKYTYRINSDDRNNENTQLLNTLFNLDSAINSNNEAKVLLNKINKNETLFDNLKSSKNFISYTFASKENKEKAIISFSDAENLIKDINREYEDIYNNYLDERKSNSTDVWNKYINKASKYNALLENSLNIKKEDNVYGLSLDFAKKIEYQTLDLEGLKCTLRYYQTWGVKYLISQKRALLGDEMGLGKTVQAIAGMVHLSNDNEKHFLVVCPNSVLVNWVREIKEHSVLNAYKLHGDKLDEQFDLWVKQGGVAVTTYEAATKIKKVPKDGIGLLVVDEAHYIKNPEALRTKNTAKFIKFCHNVLFMTGTPIENNTDEMCNLIKHLNPELSNTLRTNAKLGQFDTFKKNSEKIYYRRKREDVLKELPELVNIEEWCTMTANDKDNYKKTLRGNNYSAIRKVSWNFENSEDSSKANRLKEIVEEAIMENRKVIVFSFFLDTINKVKEMFNDICSEPINGSIPVEKRQEIIDDFTVNENKKVLIAQIIAGGTGLNIQAASVVILCEPQFKPSIENQAISRAYRMGQTRNVEVHRLLCEKTIDERIMDILKSKQAIFDKYADESEIAKKNLEISEESFKDIVNEEREKYDIV